VVGNVFSVRVFGYKKFAMFTQAEEMMMHGLELSDYERRQQSSATTQRPAYYITESAYKPQPSKRKYPNSLQ